jgi:hypothetical protein
MPTGDVHSISIQGRHDALPHPHVVVVELADNCLVIPAFDTTGAELNDALRELERIYGLFRHEACVEMDNRKRVTFVPGVTGKESTWFIARFRLLSPVEVARHRKVGTMDDPGLLDIAEGLLRFAQAQPTRVPKKYVKRVEKLAVELRERIAKRSSGP